MLSVCGIDPGLDGAIAILGDDGKMRCFNMPTFDAKKRSVDPAGLIRCLRFQVRIRHCFVEAVHSMPGMGAPSVFNFGEGFGIIKGVIAALEIPVTFIDPAKWKRSYKLSKDKELSRRRASELFPTHAGQWEMVRGEISRDQAGGRAEAALLALYGIRVCLEEPA